MKIEALNAGFKRARAVRGLLLGAALLILPVSSFAVSAISGKVFDKWVSGMYTDNSALGPFYVERVAGDAYYFQGSSMVVFSIDSVEVVSPIQVKIMLTNPVGGVSMWDRFGSEMDVYMPDGGVVTTKKIRDLTDKERVMIHSAAEGEKTNTSKISASFDCAKAATNIEKMICGSAAIAKLDVDLAQRYTSLIKLAPQDKKLAQTEQREWLKERNQCSTERCLKESYSARISELDTILRHMNKPAEFR